MDDNKAAHSHLELYMTIIFIQASMGFIQSLLCQKWYKNQLKDFLQSNFFAAAALERKYCHNYGPNQRHRSITTIPTCLTWVFRRTRVSKRRSASYRMRLLSPCHERWVQQNFPKLQIFSMAIIFDVHRYTVGLKMIQTISRYKGSFYKPF